jgi:hypothetical protein
VPPSVAFKPVPGLDGVVELRDVVTFRRERASYPIFRHNGRFEAPIYGMLAVEDVEGAPAETGAG